MPAFRVLASLRKLRKLRDTPLDIFGKTAERRMERQLIEDYRDAMENVMARVGEVGFDATRDTALALARLPEQISGFGHIKEESVVGVRVRWNALAQQLKASVSVKDQRRSEDMAELTEVTAAV